MGNSLLNRIIYIFSVFAIAGFWTSCDTEKRRELQARADQLELDLHERDSAFNQIMDLMTKVESKIGEIKKKENLIADISAGNFETRDEKGLMEDIEIINELIETTNAQVKMLSSKLNKANIEIGSFKRRINNLMSELEERKNAIALLEEKLLVRENRIMELDSEVKSLIRRVDQMDETIKVQKADLQKQDESLHRAFYVVSTEKNLLKEGLISRVGGFLGLGKSTEVEKNIPEEKLEVIDIRKTSRFYINSDRIDLVTEHPEGSYEVVQDDKKNVKYIDVTNPEEFWKISKYLVISVKG